jgi:stage V sporulation protein AC
MKSDSYVKYTNKTAPKSPLLRDCVFAFLVGGFICLLGEALLKWLIFIDINEDLAKKIIPIALIFLACFLTGIGIFDKISKFAGAGTLVPITGFANAMCSPAVDSKAEGFVLGGGAKMFTIAGPVIVYGTVASVVYGFIYWLMQTI